MIGLIGGLGTAAGVYYYRELERRFKLAGIQLRLVLIHADIEIVLDAVRRNDADALAAYLSSLILDMQRAGATVGLIPAVASHLCIDRLHRLTPIPVASMLDTIRSAIDALPSGARVALFGNEAVVRSNAYGAIDASRVVPMSDDTVESVHTLYNDIVRNALHNSPRERAALNSIAKQMIDEGADAVVLCGTDLSAFYSGYPPDYAFVDIAELHIEDILRYAKAAPSSGRDATGS
jgi:aspartate/glutamate racemase